MAQNQNSLEFKVLPWKNNGLEVNSILCNVSRNKSPDPEDFKAIHDVMSNLSPSAALLYAVETMIEIANCNALLSFDPKFLRAECKKLRSVYKQESNDPYDTVHDLEEFNSLLDLCYLSYEMEYPLISEIIDILRKQISNQIVIIDEVLDIKASMQDDQPKYTNNVIAFPVRDVSAKAE